MTSRQGPLSSIGNSVMQHRGAACSPYKPFSMVASTEEGPLPVFDLQPFLTGALQLQGFEKRICCSLCAALFGPVLLLKAL